MIETDCPYLLPRDMGIDNSTRNEPQFLKHIAKRIAEIRPEKELLFSAIYMNSLDFFDVTFQNDSTKCLSKGQVSSLSSSSKTGILSNNYPNKASLSICLV